MSGSYSVQEELCQWHWKLELPSLNFHISLQPESFRHRRPLLDNISGSKHSGLFRLWRSVRPGPQLSWLPNASLCQPPTVHRMVCPGSVLTHDRGLTGIQPDLHPVPRSSWTYYRWTAEYSAKWSVAQQKTWHGAATVGRDADAVLLLAMAVRLHPAADYRPSVCSAATDLSPADVGMAVGKVTATVRLRIHTGI